MAAGVGDTPTWEKACGCHELALALNGGSRCGKALKNEVAAHR